MMVRQTLVAIVNSHVRRELRPANAGMPRHARTTVSCRASSASCTDPSMR